MSGTGKLEVSVVRLQVSVGLPQAEVVQTEIFDIALCERVDSQTTIIQAVCDKWLTNALSLGEGDYIEIRKVR
jgi:hypothetical protein